MKMGAVSQRIEKAGGKGKGCWKERHVLSLGVSRGGWIGFGSIGWGSWAGGRVRRSPFCIGPKGTESLACPALPFDSLSEKRRQGPFHYLSSPEITLPCDSPSQQRRAPEPAETTKLKPLCSCLPSLTHSSSLLTHSSSQTHTLRFLHTHTHTTHFLHTLHSSTLPSILLCAPRTSSRAATLLSPSLPHAAFHSNLFSFLHCRCHLSRQALPGCATITTLLVFHHLLHQIDLNRAITNTQATAPREGSRCFILLVHQSSSRHAPLPSSSFHHPALSLCRPLRPSGIVIS